MRIRAKLFSLILGILISLMVLLSIILPIGIRQQMMIDAENKLLHYRRIALIFVKQTISEEDSDNNIVKKSSEIEAELSNMFDLEVSVYDRSNINVHPLESVNNNLLVVDVASKGNIAYRESSNYIYFAFPINDSSVLTMQYPLDMINQTISNTKGIIYVLTILTILLAIVSGLLVSKTFTDPIIKLNDAVKKIQQGNYNVDLKFSSKDEISELASSVNNMSQEIDKRVSQLKKMVEEEKRLKHLQRDFINSVTHEFKTPLTSIIGYTDLLQQYNGNKQLLVDAIKAIKDDSNRLNNMVERLLYLSSVENYEMILKLDDIEVVELINRSINAVKIKSKKRNIQIVTDINYTGKISGDYEMLFIMFVNVLDNAVKYNIDGGRIDITVEKSENELCISIRDTGIGIDDKDMDKIFQPFFRADKNRSKKIMGSGLGLSIVKEIVDKHNGKIYIQSNKDKGTEVVINLPIK